VVSDTGPQLTTHNPVNPRVESAASNSVSELASGAQQLDPDPLGFVMRVPGTRISRASNPGISGTA